VVLATTPTGGFTGADLARLGFLRAMIRLFTLADPIGAKRLIDDASRAMSSGAARGCIDAFLAVYWATMGKPEVARKSVEDVGQAQLPDLLAPWPIGRLLSHPETLACQAPTSLAVIEAIGSGPRLLENVLVEQQAWLRSVRAGI
jgi:hypothetical protein